MPQSDLAQIRDLLKSGRPPMSLELLDRIMNLEWAARNEDELDLYCEILIRTGVDVIMCAVQLEGHQREFYHSAFLRIADTVEASELNRTSPDFNSYFGSFKAYLSGF